MEVLLCQGTCLPLPVPKIRRITGQEKKLRDLNLDRESATHGLGDLRRILLFLSQVPHLLSGELDDDP